MNPLAVNRLGQVKTQGRTHQITPSSEPKPRSLAQGSRTPVLGGIYWRLTRHLGGCLFIAGLLLSIARSRGVSLAWNPVSGSGIGYRLYYGMASGSYSKSVDAGSATTASVSGLAPGVTYYFAVTAYTSDGLESAFSSEVTYTPPGVSNPPSIALAYPTDGASFAAPASIYLAATVFPNGDTIDRVQFYTGQQLLGDSRTPPYDLTWTGVGPGSFEIEAVAIDASGASFGSTPIRLTVASPPSTSTTQSYVTAQTPGTLRNGYSGFAGMQIRVGADPITVTALGRIVAPGNTYSHLLKLVNASDGSDVPGGSVSVETASGTAGQFQYADLLHPIVLTPQTDYYLVSEEVAGGDYWYYDDTIVKTTTAATEASGVWGSQPGQWQVNGSAGQTFGPVDFKYVTSTRPAPQLYVTKTTPGTLRNGYSGFMGMQIQVGDAPIAVTSLGRMVAAGNTATHLLKLVSGADGTDVPGTSVTMDAAAGTEGQFEFADLASPVVLSAGTTYYLVSQENAGGDYWSYDDAIVETTSAANELSAVWGFGPGRWHLNGATGQSFGPVNLQYVLIPASGLPPTASASN